MGMTGSLMYNTYWAKPELMPDRQKPGTFDTMDGFPSGRKPREMIATQAQMEAAGLPPDHRDYCAHLSIDYNRCRQEKFPWYAACKHELHLWEECQFEDWIIRMKEYERERRLLHRADRKKKKESKEHLED